MSRMSWPNRITIGRILLIAPFVICLMNLGEWPVARWVAIARVCRPHGEPDPPTDGVRVAR